MNSPKSLRNLIMTMLLALATVGCNRNHRPQTEYILEMDARDWLLRQTDHPRESLLQAALSEMQGASDSSAHPLAGFAQVVAAHGWTDRLGAWFPDLMPRQRTDDPMVAVMQAYDGDAQIVQYSMARRLREGVFTLDAQMRVHAVLDSAEASDILHHILLPQGDLGFYATWRNAEALALIEPLRMATLQIDSLDTTFDLARLMHPTREAGMGSLPEINPDFAEVCYARLRDTAVLNTVLHSPEAQKILPPNLQFMWSAKPLEDNPDLISLIALRPLANDKPQLDGEHVIEAHDEIDPNYQQPLIAITMDEEGASIWKRMTHESIGQQIAIVFDGYVYTHPTVQSEIAGGRTQITGNFTVEEAHDLATIMNASGYPARVRAIGQKPYRGE
jgi:hypothetical protein